MKIAVRVEGEWIDSETIVKLRVEWEWNKNEVRMKEE